MPSLVNFSHVCSNLVNCSRARLGATSLPFSKHHLRFALAMQRQGMIDTVEVGSKKPPPPQDTTRPEQVVKLANHLIENPWDAYPDPQQRHEPDRRELIVPDNPAQMRIWVGLKYFYNEPVIHKIEMISKPSRRVKLDLRELSRIVRGRAAHTVEGLQRPGELLFLFTSAGLLESREALERQLGGLALCRMW